MRALAILYTVTFLFSIAFLGTLLAFGLIWIMGD
jgi:hypothetical protein